MANPYHSSAVVHLRESHWQKSDLNIMLIKDAGGSGHATFLQPI
jgi:hypothetical protein